MTNKERLIALLGFQAEPNAIEAALLDNDVNGSATYVKANLDGIKKAAISLMEVLLSTPDTSNSHSGFNVNYDRDSIEERLKVFRAQTGTRPSPSNPPVFTNPKVRGVSPW